MKGLWPLSGYTLAHAATQLHEEVAYEAYCDMKGQNLCNRNNISLTVHAGTKI